MSNSPFADVFRLEAVILSGVQGAGKSTFCREHYWDTHVRINYDMLRTRRRESLLLAACIEACQPFVIDATNPTAEDRARYLAPAGQAGFYCIGIEFAIATDRALARNRQRSGKARVPDKALWATLSRKMPLTYAEGFDEIWLAEDGGSGPVLRRLVNDEADPKAPDD